MITHRISVVGVGCRYPDANDPEELWQNVLAGRRAFRQIPEVRLPSGYRGDRNDVDRTYLSHAAVLRDWEFDRADFGVPGALHRAADHSHWLALETAAAALADAGHPRGEGLDRDGVGVVLGNSLTGEFTRAAMLRLRWPFLAEATAEALRASGADTRLAGDVLARLEDLVKRPFPVPGDETLAGAMSNTIAGRICNVFDFHGTGFTVDGACASSLVAVNVACTALATGECDVMIAGGVDLSLDPFELVGFARLGALAADEMRVYDAEPTGFLPGEGCGIVVLMRADDANARGLRSYAEIVGWATSSDGTGGLTRPDEAGQLTALRRAYHRARLAPAEAELIEGHGTGTAVGDAVELAALTAARGRGASPAALGSIKANIGHTKAAAGAAGLLKVIAAIHRGVLPPTVGCTRQHPLLDAPDVPLRLLSRAEEWASTQRIAGVSSMGFGGINAHVVLQAPTAARPRRAASDRYWSRPCGDHEIVAVSASGPGALGRELTRLADIAWELSIAELRDVAMTLWRGGSRGPFRATLVARTPDELATAARAAAAATSDWSGNPCLDDRIGWSLGSSARVARVGLLMPGQAAPVRTALPWWAERHSTAELDRLPLPAADHGPDTATAQPWIVAQTLLGLDWLVEIGCPAELVTGHSLGEISALYWVGALTRRAALDLAAERGRLMADLGVPDTGMVALAAPSGAVAPLVSGTGTVISAYNAPDRVVVSGARTDLDTLVRRARASGVGAMPLDVSHGFHSAAMAPAQEPLHRVLDRTEIGPLRHRMVSTASGTVLGPGTSSEEVRKVLLAQLSDPVLFTDAIGIVAADADLLVEAGPGTILTGLAKRNVPEIPTIALDAGGDERAHALVTAALAACAGTDLEPWFADRPYRLLPASGRPRFLSSACDGPAVAAAAAVIPATRPVPGTDGAMPNRVEQIAPGSGESADPTDPLTVVVDHLARTLELPADLIRPGLTLLGDLHLSSLEAVQTIARIADALGVATPDIPSSIGSLTVSELATMLNDQPAAGTAVRARAADPVEPWIRAFTDVWVSPDPAEPMASTQWTVDAPLDHPWHRLPSDPAAARRGLAVALDAEAGLSEIVALLHKASVDQLDHLVLAHRAHPAAVGIARALHAELDHPCVVVVDLAHATDGFDPTPWAHVDTAGGFRDLVVRDGQVYARAVQAVTFNPGGPALQPGDVCLVTGGTGGITATCARELAERTGAVLVLLGRTAPDDPRVVAQLAALRERVVAHYLRADLGDEAQVTAVAAVAAEYGPVRGLLHGAAVNEPRPLGQVAAESLAATLAPKVDGLDALLRVVGTDLRMMVAFASIIGRQGLAGQAEYCIANDWMRRRVEAWATAHPQARAHAVEWSVWEGSGMAERLGVLDGLRARGVLPIHPEAGTRLLLDLLADPDAPVTVLATSRFVPTATLQLPGGNSPVLRFGERRPVHLPGVEAVLEADLSLGDDPYLDDHRIGSIAVLPAVVGAEAMAQAAALLRGSNGDRGTWSLADLRFDAPVIVEDRDNVVLRTVALAAGTGSADADAVDVVLRSGTDGFSTERFRGRVATAPPAPPPSAAAEPPSGSAAPHPFYGDVLFHRGRFRRLLRYQYLSAFRVHAWIAAEEEPQWFGRLHDPQLVLGDPGAMDAALHVLLACVPHRLALPVGAERFTVWRRPSGPTLVRAVERSHGDVEYVFDVELAQPDGAVVAAWTDLRLRATGKELAPKELPVELVGPWLSRRLLESGLGGPVELATPDLAAGPLSVVHEQGASDGDAAACAGVIARTGDDPAVAAARLRAAAAALAVPPAELAPGRCTADGLLEIGCAARRTVTATMGVGGVRLVVVAEVNAP